MARTTSKKRAKPKPKASTAPTYTLPTGLDAEYWARSIGWHDLTHAVIRSYEQALILSKGAPLELPRWRGECLCCRAPLVDGQPQCLCVKHKTCGSWVNQVRLQLGACKKQAHCRACCQCVFCATCNKPMTSPTARKRLPQFLLHSRRLSANAFCKTCASCTACCKCTACINCGTKARELCQCDQRQRAHHVDCCDSNALIQGKAGLLFVKRQPIFHPGTNFQRNRGRRFLSVESEILQFGTSKLQPVNKVARDWGCAVVVEGTVPQGGEICTSPASGDKFNDLVHQLCTVYTKTQAQVNVRCGMHVHVDARDFRYTDLVNLLYLYNKLEVALFAMLPPWRRLSRFAVPCRYELMQIAKGGGNLVETIRDLEMAKSYPGSNNDKVKKPSIALRLASNLYGTNTLAQPKRTHKTSDNQRIRYMSLNLHSWVYRRTIEFRHYQGTLNEAEMTLWPQILGAIMETAKRLPIASTGREPSILKLSDNPVEALMHVLKPKSWISSELQGFVELQLAKWSPDFSTIWPVMQDTSNAVVPLNETSSDGLRLSFDMRVNKYTYLPPRAMTWDYQWGEPLQHKGRYATVNDLLTVPRRADVAWISPIPVAAPQSKAKPSLATTELNLPDLATIALQYNQVPMPAPVARATTWRDRTMLRIPVPDMTQEQREWFNYQPAAPLNEFHDEPPLHEEENDDDYEPVEERE